MFALTKTIVSFSEIHYTYVIVVEFKTLDISGISFMVAEICLLLKMFNSVRYPMNMFCQLQKISKNPPELKSN